MPALITTTCRRAALRAEYLEALDAYVDASLYYRAGDPEWRSSRDKDAARERLDDALRAMLDEH